MSKEKNDKPPGYTVKDCHYGNVPVFETDSTLYYAGGWNRGARPEDVDLTIDLAPLAKVGLYAGDDSKKMLKLKGIDKHLKVLVHDYEKYLKTANILEILWPDYGVIPMKRQFFMDLNDALEAGSMEFIQSHPGKRKILVMCAGGHGRTGTLMAMLCLINGVLDGSKETIELFRDMYCENAIETLAQAEMVAMFAKEDLTWKVPKKNIVNQGGTLYPSYYGSTFDKGKQALDHIDGKPAGKEEDSKKAASCTTGATMEKGAGGMTNGAPLSLLSGMERYRLDSIDTPEAIEDFLYAPSYVWNPIEVRWEKR